MSTPDDFPVVDSVAGISDEELQSYIHEAEHGYDIDRLNRVPNPFFHKLHIIPSTLIDVMTDEQAETIAQELLAAHEV